MMRMHALPNNWYKMPYQEFQGDRRKMIADVIRKGYKKLK